MPTPMLLLTALLGGLLLACDNKGETRNRSENSARSQIQQPQQIPHSRVLYDSTTLNGAERTAEYFPLLKDKRVALVANHTSIVDGVHLADTLLAAGINLVRIFTPEHGFRGEAAAGERVKDSNDPATGLPIVSLYGSTKKPPVSALQNVDMVIYDIQDVGARFYTYISTLHYVMEACAEQGIQLLVLDRPNPNGFYVDGPVLEPEYSSFVGMHQVPVVHGMTVAEYARMINGEGWLKNNVRADLKWVTVEDYSHKDFYQLPVAPSPNLQTMASVYLYPSLCLFEGTRVSVGRGTDKPFMQIGHPDCDTGNVYFTPRDMKGIAMNPPHEGKKCRGFDLEQAADSLIGSDSPFTLKWLMVMHRYTRDDNFFNDFFKKLAGNNKLQQQISKGMREADIRASWKDGITEFLPVRNKYLLYEDFPQSGH